MSASEKATSAAPEAKDRLINPRAAYDWSRISSELDDMGLSATAFRVFCNLLRRSDKHSHSCYPGVRRIAEDCRLNKETVVEAIKELEKAGMLKADRDCGRRTDYEILPLSKWKMPPGTVRNEGTVDPETVRNEGTPVSGNRERPLYGNREPNPIHYNPIQETTTTPRACAPAKAAVQVAPAPSSSFSSVGRVEEEPTGELTPEDRVELDQVANDFGSDGRQKAKAVAIAKRRGMAFVREQAKIVRTQPKIENLAGAFEKACDSPEGWKRRKTAAKKPRRKPDVALEPEQPAVAEPLPAVQEYAAEWQFWQQASEELREAWLQDEFLRRWAPKPGQEPRRVFLARLHEMMALAEQAASEVTVLERAQQPQEQAA